VADEPDFLYFAFGSNLDEPRLQLHCPSAVLIAPARLADHRLAFSIESANTWHGGVADIVPATGEEVWGVLWAISGEHSRPLDEQEGLFRDPPAYRRYRVTVTTPGGDEVTCRSYQVVSPNLEGYAPSPAYRETLLRGARAARLPAGYVTRLEAIEDNGYAGGEPG
jgi:gamma-glutamylcyclotransferase